MTTGQKLIKRELLTGEEADCIYQDLTQLETGVWDLPDWAEELSEHYEVGPAHVAIQLVGWQAAAKAYRDVIRRAIDDSLP